MQPVIVVLWCKGVRDDVSRMIRLLIASTDPCVKHPCQSNYKLQLRHCLRSASSFKSLNHRRRPYLATQPLVNLFCQPRLVRLPPATSQHSTTVGSIFPQVSSCSHETGTCSLTAGVQRAGCFPLQSRNSELTCSSASPPILFPGDHLTLHLTSADLTRYMHYIANLHTPLRSRLEEGEIALSLQATGM